MSKRIRLFIPSSISLQRGGWSPRPVPRTVGPDFCREFQFFVESSKGELKNTFRLWISRNVQHATLKYRIYRACRDKCQQRYFTKRILVDFSAFALNNICIFTCVKILGVFLDDSSPGLLILILLLKELFFSYHSAARVKTFFARYDLALIYYSSIRTILVH